MIKAAAMANCTKVIDLRKNSPLLLWRQFPFNTFIGLKDDSTKAGYNPANNKVMHKKQYSLTSWIFGSGSAFGGGIKSSLSDRVT